LEAIWRSTLTVRSSNSSRTRIRTDTRFQTKGRKKSINPRSCVQVWTLTLKICQHYHLSLHRVSTTVVQLLLRGHDGVEAKYWFSILNWRRPQK
jgi:hypothetical protein